MASPDATTQLLKTLGQLAGIGGIAFGVLLLIFQGIIGIRKLFPQLTQEQAYKLLRLMVVICAIAVISGIVVYGIGIGRQNTTTTTTSSPTQIFSSTSSPTASSSPRPTKSPTSSVLLGEAKPPNCIKMKKDRCTSYKFDVTLHGGEHAKEYYTVSGLKPGAKLRAIYSAIVQPAVTSPNPAGATVVVRVFGPGTNCGDFKDCESSHRWPTKEPWEAKKAMVEVKANEASVVFIAELIVCSYAGESSLCQTVSGGTLTVDVL
jgi:hypothetical protein